MKESEWSLVFMGSGEAPPLWPTRQSRKP